MQYNSCKNFNITTNRPQVLLLGNGILRTKDHKVEWKDVIKKLARDDYDDKTNWEGAPYSVQASIITHYDDSKRWSRYADYFDHTNSTEKESYKYVKSERINKLMQIPFDAVLTTNYTYEIENELKENYYQLKNKLRYAHTTSKKQGESEKNEEDKTFLLRTFNRLKNVNGYEQDIWHVHGEVRRKSSLILTHDEYGRLISGIQRYSHDNGKKYEKDLENFKMKSWFDYLLLSDVYVLGLGFDFSELDLWWIVSRKQRCKSKYGKLFFYSPQNTEGKLSDIQNVLKSFDVELVDCNCVVPCGKCIFADEYYDMFYNTAIDDIARRVNENKEAKK